MDWKSGLISLDACLSAQGVQRCRAWQANAHSQDPHLKETASFAKKFAQVIPDPRAESSSQGECTGYEPGVSQAWCDELQCLLLHLQTNLFYMDDITIGIYPSAWLCEHACRPNARLRVDDVGVLRLIAIRDVEIGAPISFSYVSGMENRELADDGYKQRQDRISRELGFTCRCDVCLSETHSDTLFTISKAEKS